MKLLDIGALQQSSQGLAGPKGSGAASASGLFKQLLSGAGAQSGLVNAETAGATLSINDAMQIIEKWMQSPEEGINGDLLSALQTLQGQTLDSSDLKSLEELFQKMELAIYGEQADKPASEHSEQLIQVHFSYTNCSINSRSALMQRQCRILKQRVKISSTFFQKMG